MSEKIIVWTTFLWKKVVNSEILKFEKLWINMFLLKLKIIRVISLLYVLNVLFLKIIIKYVKL